MNRLKLITMAALTLLMVAGQWSCSKEPTATDADVPVRLSCSIAGGDTRVQYLDSGNGYFEQGDLISLSINKSGSDLSTWLSFNNIDVTNPLIDNSGTPLTWGAIQPNGLSGDFWFDFRAHYPAWETIDLNFATGRFFKQGDDPLFAVSNVKYGSGVVLTFNHCAAQLVVNLKWKDANSADAVAQTLTDPATVKVGEVLLNGWQDWGAGLFVDTTTDVSSGDAIVGTNITSGTCSTTLPPQSLEGKTLTVAYQKLNGQTQVVQATLPITAKLDAGKTLTINATLKGDLLELGSVTVGEWETVDMQANANINVSNKIQWNDAVITIATSMDLSELARRVNGTQPDGKGGYFKASDFEGQSFTLLNNIAILEDEWPMIGTGDYESPDNNHPFQGTFDGSGYEITNLKINSNSDCLGLFGCLGDKGKVMNIVISGSVVSTGTGHSGGIVGLNYGIVEGCTFNGTVSGSTAADSCIGGVVGHNYGTVRLCCSTASSKAESQHRSAVVGGIAGYNAKYGVIVGCYSAATINATSGRRGGIVGCTDNRDYDGILDDYYANCTTDYCYFISSSASYTVGYNNFEDQEALDLIGVDPYWTPANTGSFTNIAALNNRLATMNTQASTALSSNNPNSGACQFMFIQGTNGEYPKIVKK